MVNCHDLSKVRVICHQISKWWLIFTIWVKLIVTIWAGVRQTVYWKSVQKTLKIRTISLESPKKKNRKIVNCHDISYVLCVHVCCSWMTRSTQKRPTFEEQYFGNCWELRKKKAFFEKLIAYNDSKPNKPVWHHVIRIFFSRFVIFFWLIEGWMQK